MRPGAGRIRTMQRRARSSLKCHTRTHTATGNGNANSTKNAHAPNQPLCRKLAIDLATAALSIAVAPHSRN